MTGESSGDLHSCDKDVLGRIASLSACFAGSKSQLNVLRCNAPDD